MWSTTQIWATSKCTQIVSKCVWSELRMSKIWVVEANFTWKELRRLEMLVDLALTLLLTPRPEEGITREVIEMRNKVTDTVINIVMDALLCWYTPPEMQQVDTEFRGCVAKLNFIQTSLPVNLSQTEFVHSSPITNRDFHFKMENFPNMVVTMVHFFLQQLETFSTLGIKFNFRYIGVLHPWLQHSRLNNIVGEKAFLHSHSGVQLNTVATQKVDILKPVLFCLHFIQLLLIKGSGCWTTVHWLL